MDRPPPSSTLLPYTTLFRSLRDELEEAERFHDPGRASRAQSEIEFLTAELSRAVGLGGRVRRAAGAAERARRSEEHTSELQSHVNLVCRLLLEKKNKRTRLH